MKGEVKIAVKNRNVSFNFTLERNITILTGDSGTGKTKLINMIRDYSQFGKSKWSYFKMRETLSCVGREQLGT